MFDITPVFKITIDNHGKVDFVNEDNYERYIRYLKSLSKDREYDLLIRDPKKHGPRSGKEERYHWKVQVPLWGDKYGLRDMEAHYDLLREFPVTVVDEETGEIYYKTSKAMTHQEYHTWVFELVLEGMAQEPHGIVCPLPNEVEF